MGYRSDVAIALSCKAVTRMDEAFLEADDETQLELLHILRRINNSKPDNGAHLYVWKGYPWYDEEPEVKFFHKLISEMPQECFFVRVGEEEGDAEVKGAWRDNPFGLRLICAIEIGNKE